MAYLNNSHELRYQNLIKNMRIHEYDLERRALFYIICGNDDLFRKRNYIYDFYENIIQPECLDSREVDFCSSSKNLIRIGFNLYNGYTDDTVNPLWMLGSLDATNLILLINAICLRFSNKKDFHFNGFPAFK